MSGSADDEQVSDSDDDWSNRSIPRKTPLRNTIDATQPHTTNTQAVCPRSSRTRKPIVRYTPGLST